MWSFDSTLPALWIWIISWTVAATHSIGEARVLRSLILDLGLLLGPISLLHHNKQHGSGYGFFWILADG